MSMYMLYIQLDVVENLMISNQVPNLCTYATRTCLGWN